MTRRQFEESVQRTLEGTASREEVQDLEGELMRSVSRRREFREAHLLHEMLHLEATKGSAVLESARVIPINRILMMQQRRAVRLALCAAAALVVLSGLLMHVMRTQSPPRAIAITAAPHSSFRITAADGSHIPVDEVAIGSGVELEQGTLKLEFRSGVTGIIQAPARLVVEDRNRLRMDSGRGRFHVLPEARGFTVKTPEVHVVDLGTDFGIAMRPDKDPEVHVFEGRVNLSAQRGLHQSLTLGAGKAVRVTIPGRLRDIPVDDSLFYESLPADLPYVQIDFEPGQNGSLRAAGSHPAVKDMKVSRSGESPGVVPGPFGMAGEFDGSATPLTTDWPGVEGRAPRTICAWIRTEGDLPFRQYQTVAAWGDPTIGLAGKCELLLFQARKSTSVVPRLSFDQYIFSGTTNVADGQWHHLAATCFIDPGNGETPVVRMYVDGREEPLDPSISNTRPRRIRGPVTRTRVDSAMPLVIGYTDRPDVERGFRGEIDEVKVFEAAVPAGRIREMAAEKPEGR